MSELPVYPIRVPNPFFEDANTVYVIASEPLSLIDTGVATARAFQRLASGLEQHGLAIGDVGRVILTHKHIDHIGNAWRIQQLSGAEVLVHQCETPAVTDVDPAGQRFRDVVAQRMQEWGAPPSARAADSSESVPEWEIQSAVATALVDGQQIPLGKGMLEVIHTPGHTMGSICLRYGRYLFTGDHILRHLSPNIGAGDLRSRGLLGHYLDSVKRVRQLADDELTAMPGHGDPFTDLRDRCDQLVTHHLERLAKIVDILGRGTGQTVYQIARQLFGDMQRFHVVLGCAEAHAHLEYLADQSRVVFEDGVYRLA
jgi:glyoxylase-like metal-dependent hydrolase (beta-lactamase superfamily II)